MLLRIRRPTALLLFFSVVFTVIHFAAAIWESEYTPVLYFMNVLGPAVALIALIQVVRQKDGADRRFWSIVMLSVACELIAQGIWGSYDLLWQTEAPEIGIADLFWSLQSLLYLIALYVWLDSSGEKIRYLFDSTILLVSLSVISWEYVIKPSYYGLQELDLLTITVDIWYPLSSLIMVFTLAVWLLNGERRLSAVPLTLLAAGFFGYVAGDTLYVILIDVNQIDWIEPWIDPFWTGAALCMALSGMYSLQSQRAVRDHAETRRFRVIRFTVPYVGLLLLVGILVIRENLTDMIVTGLALTVIMILIRQVMFLLERERMNEQLQHALIRSEHLANHDSLTGLLSRRAFEEELEQLLSSTAERGQHAALMFFDLDKFKQVNDQYGHRIGDLLLMAVARRMSPYQSAVIRLARLGGDEFAVSFASPEDIGRLNVIAEWIVKELSKPYELEGIQIEVSPSIGIALFPDHGANPIDLMRAADTAMYSAKRNGGGQFYILEVPLQSGKAD